MSKDKVRIYQLARDLNVESSDLIEKLRKVGCDIRNHMSTIDDATKQLAIDLVTGKKSVPAPEAKPKTAPVAQQSIPDPNRIKKVNAIARTRATEETEAEEAYEQPEENFVPQEEIPDEPEVVVAEEPQPVPVVEPVVVPEPVAPTPIPIAKSREIRLLQPKRQQPSATEPKVEAEPEVKAEAQPEPVPTPIKAEVEAPKVEPAKPAKVEEPVKVAPVVEPAPAQVAPPVVAAVPEPKPMQPIPKEPPAKPALLKPSRPASNPPPAATGPSEASKPAAPKAAPVKPAITRPATPPGPIPMPSNRPTNISANAPAPGTRLRDIRQSRVARPNVPMTRNPLSQARPINPVQPTRRDDTGAVKPVKKFTMDDFRRGAAGPQTAGQPGQPPRPGVVGRGPNRPPVDPNPVPGKPSTHHDRDRRDRNKSAAAQADEDRLERQRRRIKELGRSGYDDEDDEYRIRRQRGPKLKKKNDILVPKGPVELLLPINGRSFSEAAGKRIPEVLGKMMEIGIATPNINTTLSQEQAELLALAFGIEIKVKKQRDTEDEVADILNREDSPEESLPRSPVVTFMGHVDHGKTSLMDRIRSAKVAQGEAGGITQHIGAYQVEHKTGETITFLDTPGHEAFTAMRARGANVTDIVVLVIAADDGVMPQTEEAISHAKAAEVPIVVAMNKIDLAGAKPDRLQQQLSKFGLVPEAWGGDTLFVGTSAITGQGMDELLESIMIVAELKELKANPNRPAVGTCIEASLNEGRGVVATILVQKGTLRRGDVLLCGSSYGKVRAMYNDRGQLIDEAGPSTPVVVTGLDLVPEAGSQFVVLDEISEARDVAGRRRVDARARDRAQREHISLESFNLMVQGRRASELLLVLKADVRGSLEAIKKELSELKHDEVRVRIIHEGLGGISESDILLADASDAIVVGFNVAPDDRASSIASEKGVEIRRYEIIYQLSNEIRNALEGMLKPETKEVVLGRAVVQRVFSISKVGTVAGCRVVSGVIERAGRLRIIRDGKVIGNYPIDTLKRVQDDAREVREGFECGIKLKDFDDIKVQDMLECFKIEEIKRTL